jgi:hypothetical protein
LGHTDALEVATYVVVLITNTGAGNVVRSEQDSRREIQLPAMW